MKTTTLTRPAFHSTGSLSPYSMDDVSPNSSAIVGVTLVGDLEDVLAVLRTAVLLARNLRATLYLDFSGKDAFPVHFGQTPCPALSELLDSARGQLGKLISVTMPVLILEVTITVASFVSEGTVSMRVRTANANSGESAI